MKTTVKNLILILGAVAVMLFSGCSSKPSNDPVEFVEEYIENVIKARNTEGAEKYFETKGKGSDVIYSLNRNVKLGVYGEDLDELEYEAKLKDKTKLKATVRVALRNKTGIKEYYRNWRENDYFLIYLNGGWKISHIWRVKK